MSLAAAIVRSTSLSVCAAERNHASNCDGGGQTPRAIIPRKNAAYFAVSALTALLEPMLMVFLGTVIGFIVIAMYLPIFKMASVVG